MTLRSSLQDALAALRDTGDTDFSRLVRGARLMGMNLGETRPASASANR